MNERAMNEARKLGNAFATKKVDILVKELQGLVTTEKGRVQLEEFIMSLDVGRALGKYLALAYSLGYMDGQSGTRIRTLHI